jgi:hypothetical protein
MWTDGGSDVRGGVEVKWSVFGGISGAGSFVLGGELTESPVFSGVGSGTADDGGTVSSFSLGVSSWDVTCSEPSSCGPSCSGAGVSSLSGVDCLELASA